MKATWKRSEIEAFRLWHECRLAELDYPVKVQEELRNAREKWLPAQAEGGEP